MDDSNPREAGRVGVGPPPGRAATDALRAPPVSLPPDRRAVGIGRWLALGAAAVAVAVLLGFLAVGVQA